MRNDAQAMGRAGGGVLIASSPLPMSDSPASTTLVLTGLTAGFLALGGFFVLQRGASAPAAAPKFAGAAAPVAGTVRISATQLKASGGDVSGLDCYACHDEKKPQVLRFMDERRLVLPKEHADLIISMRNCASCHGAEKVELKYAADGALEMPKAHADLLRISHGKNNRNDYCFNCHNPAKLDQLVTRDGSRLTFDQATLLCASCHGPTYQDWEVGVHGRTTGYWDRSQGKITREGCTSCHDPHAPAIPRIIPLPGPRAMHPAAKEGEKDTK